MKPAVHTNFLVRNAENVAVWVHVDRDSAAMSSPEELLSLLNAEIQEICNDYISTLDDGMVKPSPRPNPTPRVFVEQGNELSRLLLLSWEE